jgi:hypothetical protein
MKVRTKDINEQTPRNNPVELHVKSQIAMTVEGVEYQLQITQGSRRCLRIHDPLWI